MSSHCPFHLKAWLAVVVAAALASLAPAAARAQVAQQAALGDAKPEAPKSEAAKSEATKPSDALAVGTSGNAAQNNPPQKSIAARAVDRMKDMFARVPCL